MSNLVASETEMKSNRMARRRMQICRVIWLVWPASDDEGMERIARVIGRETESGVVIEEDCSSKINLKVWRTQ
jgi:hypothetical protein